MLASVCVSLSGARQPTATDAKTTQVCWQGLLNQLRGLETLERVKKKETPSLSLFLLLVFAACFAVFALALGLFLFLFAVRFALATVAFAAHRGRYCFRERFELAEAVGG